MKPLRPHQQTSIDLLREALRSGSKRPMLQLPTGAGKTRVASEIINLSLAKGNRVTFCVPAISLVDQTAREFWDEGIRDVGVMQANHDQTHPDRPVQIASIQTLARREIPSAGLVIIDEAHRRSSFVTTWMGMPEWSSVPFIGLSATPWAKGLGQLYDKLIIGSTTAELIEAGYLAPFTVFAPSHPDLSGVRTVAGEYHEGDLAKAMAPLVGDVVTTWLQKGEGRPTLCFAVDCAHARHLQEQFQDAGVACGYIDAHTSSDERETVRKQFANGDLQVVTSVGCLTTGVDWDVRCIVLARPTKSEMLFVQMVGRGLRTADGKQDCLIKGTKVLTNKGLVSIQDITFDHKVWDGVNFVDHAGAICKGVRKVISHSGITATPDHKVMTNVGWITLSEAHRRGLRIARAGFGRIPLRLPGSNLSEGGGVDVSALRGGAMRSLFRRSYGKVPQHQEAAEHRGVPALQWTPAGPRSSLALPTLPGAARPLLQSAVFLLRKVWWAWNSVQVRQPERSIGLGSRKPWARRSNDGVGSGEQRWPLRAWKSALGSPYSEHEQHPKVWIKRAVHSLSEKLSRDQVRGCDASPPDQRRPFGRADHQKVSRAIVQAEGEVWDILNAGPLQRFTANGRLVHNCLILDHTDTTLKLGFVTDIHHARLDGGKLAVGESAAPDDPKPKPPRECKKCSRLMAKGEMVCSSCGYKPERGSAGVDWVEGELKEISAARKANADEWASKVAFARQLKAYSIEKAKGPKWFDSMYKAKFGVWPNDHRVRYAEPAASVGKDVRSWIISRGIAYSKSKGRRAAEELRP